jgi:hypothetical protein
MYGAMNEDKISLGSQRNYGSDDILHVEISGSHVYVYNMK